MYKLLKIDLLDSYPLADIFDEKKYSLEMEHGDPGLLTYCTIQLFRQFNPSFTSYDEWIHGAENGAYELELHSDTTPLLRGSMILLAAIIEKALLLAIKYHSKQVRKGDSHPYLEHPLEVGWILYKHGYNPNVIAAGYCHDLIEDTDCTEEEIVAECGEEVLRLVKAVSNDPALSDNKDWEEKKMKYVNSVRAGGKDAIAVSITDKLANLHSFFTQYEKEGSSLWEKFNRGKDEKIWFEKEVLKMAKEEGFDARMLKRYESEIKKLEALTIQNDSK